MPKNAALRRRLRRRPTSTGGYGTAASLFLVSPLMLLLAVAFAYPVGLLIWNSFFVPEPTLAHYIRIVAEPLYLVVLWRTFAIGFIVTILAFVLGYPVAYAMARVQGRRAMLVAACVLIPLWTSVLVRSYAWIVLLQRNGIVNTTLQATGLTETPLPLLYTEGAVILAMTHVLLPFMVLPIYSNLRNIPDELTKAARNLGASAAYAFFRVTFPLSLPGIASGTLITFILALGFYITPVLVGGPRTLMMSTLIAQQTTELLDWPFAGALSAVLLVSTLLLAVLYRKALSFSKGFSNG